MLIILPALQSISTGLFFITLVLLTYPHISYKQKLSFSTPQAELSLLKIHGLSHGRIAAPLPNL